MLRPMVAAGLVVFLPSVLQAQGRGAMSVAPYAMSAAPHVMGATPHLTSPQVMAAPGSMAHVGGTMGTQRLVGARSGVGARVRIGAPRSGPGSTSRNTVRSSGTRRHFENDDKRLRPGCNSVPGLGFDVPHLAATCGPGAVQGGRHTLQSGFFFPILDGGFFVPGVSAVGEETAASEAPPFEEDDVREPGRKLRASRDEPAPVSRPEAAPVGESREYLFVRRDGTVFFAVAFAWENGMLRYVTSEGVRRSVARDSLDLNATQQFNEQRGLNFQSPA